VPRGVPVRGCHPCSEREGEKDGAEFFNARRKRQGRERETMSKGKGTLSALYAAAQGEERLLSGSAEEKRAELVVA